MDSPSPLDPLDPNVPSRQLNGKPQDGEKALPPPPFDRTRSEAPIFNSPASTSEASSQARRPSLSGQLSFQRPRKRVVWHNKACIIALPLVNDFGKKTTRDDYLRPEDVEKRLQKWEVQGYNTRGFILAFPTADSEPIVSEGQSRAVHPDPEDEYRERSDRSYRVSIPGRREWEAYVQQLKEEKLRTLGVTFGNEEPPPRKSSTPGLISRQGSSQSSGMLLSPQLPLNSVHTAPFHPSFQRPPNPAPSMSRQGVSHFPRYSIAMPVGEKGFHPQPQFPPFQPPVPPAWSPQQYFASQPGSRVVSPCANGHLQNPSHRLTPPPPVQNSVPQVSTQGPSDMLARMRQRQSILQAQHLRQQHQQQQVLQPRQQQPTVQNKQPHATMEPAKRRSEPEIVTPVPRGHHQNLSETLQREVDEAEAYLEESTKHNEKLKDSIAKENTGNIGKEANAAMATPGGPLESKVGNSGLEPNPSLVEMLDHVGNRSGQSRHGHSSKSSVSKLNVHAPEFRVEPKESFAPEVFAFIGNPKLAKAPEPNAAEIAPITKHTKQPSNASSQTSKLNVAARTFTPGAANKPVAPLREFSFSASGPSYKHNAPAFNLSQPGQAVENNSAKNENPEESVKKIFGDINFSEVIKPSKKSRAIPIVKPDERPEKSDREVDGQEDESGRITQADGRQKRMRRDLDVGDQVPLFASSNNIPWLDHGNNERAAYFSNSESSASSKVDPTTLEAATDLLEEIIDDLSASEASSLMREPENVTETTYEPYTFKNAEEAAASNVARPSLDSHEDVGYVDPSPEQVAEATKNFLKKSSQYKTEFDYALERGVSSSRRSISSLEEPQSELSAWRHRNDLIDRVDHAGQPPAVKVSSIDRVEYLEPSFHELDAVMRHLNQGDDPDLGIERSPVPWRQPSPVKSPVRFPAPERHDSSTIHQLLPPVNVRREASSPSPNRLKDPFQYLPPTDSESADNAAIEMVARNARFSPSFRPSRNSPPIHRLNSAGSTPPSDWNDAISSVDEAKFESRTGFFDNRVNELVGGIIRQRLGPLEKTLSCIQESLVSLSSRSASRRPRSSGKQGIEVENSDADDEDEGDEQSQSMAKSPLRDRKYDQLRSSLNDVSAAQQNFASGAQLTEVIEAVRDLKDSMQQPQQSLQASTSSGDIKTIVEEAVGRQMRGRSAPVTSSSQAVAAEKSQLQIAGLESMLKVANARAEDEMKARRSTEDALADNQRLLRIALQEAAEQRESAEATERSLQEYHEERQQVFKRNAMLEGSQDSLQKIVSDLSEKNAAMEDTLAEYRLSSDQWRTEIDDARHENKDLRRVISSLKAEIEENVQDRQALRAKFERLQEDLSASARDLASDQSRWRGKEDEHRNRLEILSARLEAEARTRERLELEIERFEAQEKELMNARFLVEQTQKANHHLDTLVGQLRSETHEHQNAAARFQREYHAAKETAMMELHRTRSAMEADIESAKHQVTIVRTDLETVITRLEKQLEVATADAETARGRHELMLEEASDSRHTALREAAEAREAALQEHYRFHERTLEELTSQHERALTNILEERQRLETYFGNRLNLADEKMVHYQDKVSHLEEKLEIAKSAAHAAVQAAQAKKTAPSPSTVRAPVPSRATDVPEKISPQALRESILVLQEQLQEREARIERLDQELAAIDTTAPAKLKDADVEITWLRELLGVRIDDLQDIISILSQSSFDREAVKDAAIRLKANLQMEQQEKERALAGGQTFPSLSSLSNFTASPRALPLAAAAAWGNWRKSRDTGFGNLSAIANGSVSQTPSKSSSPQSFFAGLMTPPSTDIRTTPSASRPSRSAKAALPSTPRQTISLQDEHSRPLRRQREQEQQDPVTPPLMRKGSYDSDATGFDSDGFGDEGPDALKARYEFGEEEEPFGPRIGTLAA